MARKEKELNALQVKALARPGYYIDGQGLYLQVSPSLSKSWVFRFTLAGRTRDMGLGATHTVSLAEARGLATDARKLLREGRDPIELNRASRNVLMASAATAKTFDQCVAGLLATKEGEWKNPKHRQQWENTLQTYASPHLGKLLVTNVALPHVLAVLEPIWSTKTETAQRLRGRIEKVLDWAKAHGLRSGENPARWKGHLDQVLASPRKIQAVTHHAAVHVDAVAGFVRDLRSRDGIAAKALEFAILTAARSGEVRGATWGEIDHAGAVWTIPASRMKTGVEHRVPLSPQALRLLSVETDHQPDEPLFPAPRGGVLSDMTLSAVMRRMKVDAVPHGFRSTFRDWCGERTNYPRELAEHALAHVLGSKVEAAYRRGDALEKRRPMMNAWAEHCERVVALSASVVPIRAKAGA